MQNPTLICTKVYSVYPWNEPVAEDLPFGIIGQPVDLMTLQTEINGAIEYDLMSILPKALNHLSKMKFIIWNNLVRFQRITACCLRKYIQRQSFILLVGQRK
ncbi:MAG: hypothetical protein IPF46_10505 [Saprospiraceae bacterium]|nr:hypothetical protein [Candidatus Vicinibacter affinis]